MGRLTQGKRGTAFCSAVAAVCAVVLCWVPSALAVELNEGDWYITKTGVRDAWDQGVTGKGVKVAVLDSQIVSDYPAIAGKGVASKLVLREGASSCKSTDGTRTMRVSNPSLRTGEEGLYMTHGTEMTAYIVGNGSGYDGSRGLVGVAQDAQATHYPMTFGVANLFGLQTACEVNGNVIGFGDTVRAAVADGNRVINMSWHSEDNNEAVEALVEAMRAGVVIVSAAGNNTKDSGPRDYVGEPTKTNRFPGLVAVNMVDASGVTTRRDGGVTLLAPGDDINGYARGDARNASVTSGGSSAASAIASGMLALVMSKWPDATGNQVLQSVVHHTQGNTSGEPVFDKELRSGFGVIDLPKLLAVDPSQYPDINPLLEAAVVNSEKYEETKGMYTDRSGWGDHQIANTQVFDLDGSSHIDVQREASLVGEEYERQKDAWARVERCRADGGADCMQYSATRTGQGASSSSSGGQSSSSKADGARDGVSSPTAVPSSSSSNHLWLWLAVGAGVAALIALIVVACLFARRGRGCATVASMPANVSGMHGVGGGR
ncbi:S8 family serine peptidase [Bifidobacterium criceti]|uniref:Peptidase, S8/S53 family n=1 Tax=Bifidobacterium criceti TaxID=1960969 RepID=A0A2A2EI42_9BIFI|nr:S8 family serine peptidase [Bifidobacterium criceti]PAU68914.1 peptidase, S8/S53 family [Bifidobacterium criceti]